jgi:aryl-phospho-beta-D-glucosidase BglC (GH1 family)
MLPILAVLAIAQTADSNGVPRALISKLTTGVNVTRWFCYMQGGNEADHFEHYLTDADFATFKKLKVRFVRLCISPDVIDRNGTPDPAVLPYIDRAIGRFTKAGMAVLWDLHDNGQLHLDVSKHDNSSFPAFWQAIAEHYKGRYRDSLVFELLNEPQFVLNPYTWYALQEDTVKAVRRVDPSRTIMVTSNAWSGIDNFVRMVPLGERNLIYTYHCYDPFFFTHQGAEWTGEWPARLKSVPFPSSPEAVLPILDENDAKYRMSLIQYGGQHYDAAYLESRLKLAAEFAKKNRVPVVLGEFGAYPKVSPPDSRARWFEAMRSAIDRLKVPNALWGYDDALGLGRRAQPDGTLWLDPVTLKSFFGVKP